ncbi:hypothetical protein HS125_04930 [bacterium]|nr:hypothetical protein [bacterium]
MLRRLLLFALLVPSAGLAATVIEAAPGDRESAAWRYAHRVLASALEAHGGGTVQVAEGGPGGEGYRLSRGRRGAFLIEAREPAGRAYGALRLAREITLAGKIPANLGLDESPAYPLRMVEVEAPFYPPEARPERPYWLGGFRNMYDSDQPPYLDLSRFNRIPERFERYCQIMLENGYNALLFIQVESRWVDPEIFPGVVVAATERARLAAWRDLYARLLDIGTAYGFRCYLWNSEVTFPPAVMASLQRAGAVQGRGRAAAADVRHPALLEALETKYRYFARTYPQMAGYLFRVGELGEPGAVVFRPVGRDHRRGEPERVADFFGAMENLVAGELDKQFIARTWWVGHPSIHTDPAMYATAVSRLRSGSSWVCIKNTHEFWGGQPLNPTIAAARHPVIVEYQGCREYDGMGAVPVVPARHYSKRFRQLESARPAGVWAWVKFGGSGGKYRLPYFYGFDDWTEANVYLIGRLAWTPRADARRLLREFAVLKVGREAAADYARIMELSEEARDRGMYVRAVCDENPWHPMFPVYRNYFYAGELIASEDGVSTDDPVKYIFDHYRSRRGEMRRDARRALAARQEGLRLAERVAARIEPRRAAGLLENVRHGLALQEVLSAWILAADACYAGPDENAAARLPRARRQAVARLAALKDARARYDAEFGEYIDRQSGLRGFITRAEKTLAQPPE